MNEEIFAILNDADDVMESVGCDPLGISNALLEKTITVAPSLSSSLNEQNLKDPAVVSKLKKQLQSAKRWDKVLKVLQKLNAILAGGVLVGGAVKVKMGKNAIDTAVDKANDAFWNNDQAGINSAGNNARRAALDVRNTKVAMFVILLIQTAVAVLTPLVKKSLRDKEITNLATIRGPIENSIKLYEQQMKNVSSEADKKKLQDAIDRLKDLENVMNSESERIADEDKPKTDKNKEDTKDD